MNPASSSSRLTWSQQIIRFIIFSLVRLFYPRIEVQGIENVPANSPVIFVLNHPNGLLDPMVLMVGLKQRVAFLAKSTLFGNPVGKTLCEAFGAMPIYRRKDDGLAGGAQGDASERNEAIFARCRALLQEGGAMALFPEGTTHSGAQLLQLRTGAARIALSAEDEVDWTAGVLVVPVGLWYQKKASFRSSVLLVMGEAFDLLDYADSYAMNERHTVQKVTELIADRLDKVVLQAENAELLAAIPVLATWIAPNGTTLTQQHEWTSKLLSAYQHLQHIDPARLESIAQQAWDYAKTLQTLGIDNPWTLELAAVRPWRLARMILRLIVTFPLALAGFMLSYLPYRLAGPIATYGVGPYDTQISLIKLILGSIFVLVGWILEAVAFGLWLGPLWGLSLFIAAPPLAYIALRWGEDWRHLHQLISSSWLRWRRGKLVQSLTAQRQTLAQQVMNVVQFSAKV